MRVVQFTQMRFCWACRKLNYFFWWHLLVQCLLKRTERILEKLLKMGLLSSVEFLAKERRKGYIKRAFLHISVT